MQHVCLIVLSRCLSSWSKWEFWRMGAVYAFAIEDLVLIFWRISWDAFYPNPLSRPRERPSDLSPEELGIRHNRWCLCGQIFSQAWMSIGCEIVKYWCCWESRGVRVGGPRLTVAFWAVMMGPATFPWLEWRFWVSDFGCGWLRLSNSWGHRNGERMGGAVKTWFLVVLTVRPKHHVPGIASHKQASLCVVHC